MSGALALAAASPRNALDGLGLVARGACIPRSHRTVAITEVLLARLPLPEHCTDSSLRPTLSLSVTEACWLSWSFGQTIALAYLRGYVRALRECRLVHDIFVSLYLQLTGISQTGAYNSHGVLLSIWHLHLMLFTSLIVINE